VSRALTPGDNMNIEPLIGKSKSIEAWIDECINNRGLGFWLVFDDRIKSEEIELSTELSPIIGDTGDFSDEEFDDFEDSLINNGYNYFLNLDQIEDVIDNYTMQKPSNSKKELLDAVIFYFSRDAFVCL